MLEFIYKQRSNIVFSDRNHLPRVEVSDFRERAISKNGFIAWIFGSVVTVQRMFCSDKNGTAPVLNAEARSNLVNFAVNLFIDCAKMRQHKNVCMISYLRKVCGYCSSS